MLVTALLVFVLPTSLRCVGASVVGCRKIKIVDLFDDDKCVAKDILWGWLNVTNKCNVRALEVLKNVTELRKRAKEVEVKAKEAIAEYKELHNSIKTVDAGHITSNIEKAIKDAEDAIMRVNNASVNASAAEKSAKSLLDDEVVSSYSSIILASTVISGYSCSTAVNYTGTKEMVEKIKTDKCKNNTEKYNVSARLSSYAEKLDEIENLTEWKDEMVKLVYKTHEEVMSYPHKKRLWTINNDKVKEVKEAIKNSTDKLVVAIEMFKAINVSVDEASKTVKNTVSDMEAINKTMLSSLEGNGTLLCQLVGQYSEASAQLHEANGRLATAQGNINSAAKAAENALASVAATESLVEYVSGNISLLSRAGYSSVLRRLTEMDIASETKRNISYANAAALMAVKLSGNGRSNASIALEKIKLETGSLESIKSQIIKHLNETGINISSLTAEACNKGLSNLLNGSVVVAFGRAVGLNSSGAAKAQEALGELTTQVELVNATLNDINSKLKEAEKATKDVEQHGEDIMSTVRSSVIEAANDAMKDLCETVKELHKLRLDSTSLNEEAEGILGNVSILAGLSNATRSKMSEAIETIPNVAEYFGVANRELTVFARAAKKIEKLHNKVQNDVASFLEEEMKREAHINTTRIEFMKKLFTNEGSSSIESNSPTLVDSLCNPRLSVNAPNVKAVDAFSMLLNLTDISALKTVADNIKLKVVKMRDSLKKANAVSDSAEAAVKEAIETALQENERQRCTPLYTQLFNAVRRFL
ncbi:hypothetical protein, conserved in T. vivax [Trypanosoma vivax Y486]|uniref:Uncharacterized protein n=1 Tax=Trypanosoma vivax (strain Y486) TaxID=1055687 RepID=F9WUL9_TRYVY|nr:hypothetical protein, conserved in T. vivax [Trypanosoma vivax Y486]|eukprot:CCD21268.1 hypothetical protein, conserved in T. vivax [Trypanosoma vivax Y486]